MPTTVVNQSIDPIRTSRLGAVLLLMILVSSVFPSRLLCCWFGVLSVRLRDATYFSTRTKQETSQAPTKKTANVQRKKNNRAKPINTPVTENLSAQTQTWAGRLAWLGHLLDVQKVAGPNPVRPTTFTYFDLYVSNEAGANFKFLWYMFHLGCDMQHESCSDNLD